MISSTLAWEINANEGISRSNFLIFEDFKDSRIVLMTNYSSEVITQFKWPLKDSSLGRVNSNLDKILLTIDSPLALIERSKDFKLTNFLLRQSFIFNNSSSEGAKLINIPSFDNLAPELSSPWSNFLFLA